MSQKKRHAILLVVAVIVAQGRYLAWQALRPPAPYPLGGLHTRTQSPTAAPTTARRAIGNSALAPSVPIHGRKIPKGAKPPSPISPVPQHHQVDDIFANIAAGETEAYYYLTSPYGKLHKSIYIKTEPQLVRNAEERFLKEQDFWQTWLRAKIELGESRTQ